MNHYRIDESGRAVVSADYGPVMRMMPPLPPSRFSVLTGRQRRRVARDSAGRGRRAARPVSRFPPTERLPDSIEMRRHVLQDGQGHRVGLYVRADVELTQKHIDAVEVLDWQERGR